MMNDRGKSDRFIVPEKSPNKADSHAAEAAEGRDRAKGNSPKHDKPWTLSQEGLPSALERVGQLAADPRQEPNMGKLYVRIRAGGGERSPSLPRHHPGRSRNRWLRSIFLLVAATPP